MSDSINGWLVLDKPSGITSAKAVNIVKKSLKVKKIGHAGTLDPLASGILPLALGEATKTSAYAMGHDKEYEFTIKWGEETDSLDSEGQITSSGGKIPSETEINSILPLFTGVINQTPPAYSAIKINGERAYKLARKGIDVEMQSRPIKINSLRITSHNDDKTTFHTSCGKGTYIRSLARDIAHKLGTYGHIIMLRRLKVGKFSLDNAILLENIAKLMYKDNLYNILPVEVVLDDIPVVTFTKEQADAIKCGKQVDTGQIINYETASIFSSNRLIALAEVQNGIVKPLRVFNL